MKVCHWKVKKWKAFLDPAIFNKPSVWWHFECHYSVFQSCWGRQWYSSLWHCATRWKVAGLIPNSVTGIFHWLNPSGCTLALGLTRPLTEMSTRNIPWEVKAAGAYGWQLYHLYVPIGWNCGSFKLLELLGPVQPCTGIDLPLISVLYLILTDLYILFQYLPKFNWIFSKFLVFHRYHYTYLEHKDYINLGKFTD